MKPMDLVQIEQLKQVGSRLATARQEQSIPLEEIALKTYIPLRLLEALELGQVERLPEPVFVQGFIRRFADLVGLDGAELSQQILVYPAPVPQPGETAIADTAAEAEPISPSLPSSMDLPRAIAPTTQFSLPKVPLILAGGAVILIGGVGLLVSLNRSQPNQPAAINPSPRPLTTVEPTLAASPAPQPSPSVAVSVEISPTPSPSPSPLATGSVQVSIRLSDRSWVEVEVDGKPVGAGEVLPTGTRRAWSGQQKIRLRLGNAGAVQVSYNNGDQKPAGGKGDVVDLVFPPVSPTPSPSSGR